MLFIEKRESVYSLYKKGVFPDSPKRRSLSLSSIQRREYLDIFFTEKAISVYSP